MVETANKYFGCPVCGMMIKFRYNADTGLYVSKCPYCGNLLEIEKNEYEDDSKDIDEIYFKPDF